jgi:hypothetical protein
MYADTRSTVQDLCAPTTTISHLYKHALTSQHIIPLVLRYVFASDAILAISQKIRQGQTIIR